MRLSSIAFRCRGADSVEIARQSHAPTGGTPDPERLVHVVRNTALTIPGMLWRNFAFLARGEVMWAIRDEHVR
jgi:hypothetical protein